VSWINRLVGSFRKNKLDFQLDDELQFHIEMRTREFISEGVTPGEARRRAQRLLCNQLVVKERTREMDTIAWIETLGQDLRYAGRILRRSPGFTLVAVLSLAVGIGANTTIFSAMDAVLLRRLPYPDSDRLVTIVNTPLEQPGQRRSVSTGDVVHWKAESTVFERIDGSEWGVEPNALSGAGTPERVGLQYVTWGLCPLLGIRPVLGSFCLSGCFRKLLEIAVSPRRAA